MPALISRRNHLPPRIALPVGTSNRANWPANSSFPTSLARLRSSTAWLLWPRLPVTTRTSIFATTRSAWPSPPTTRGASPPRTSTSQQKLAISSNREEGRRNFSANLRIGRAEGIPALKDFPLGTAIADRRLQAEPRFQPSETASRSVCRSLLVQNLKMRIPSRVFCFMKPCEGLSVPPGRCKPSRECSGHSHNADLHPARRALARLAFLG